MLLMSELGRLTRAAYRSSGGLCTLIGTSTNLVLNAAIEGDDHPPIEPFTFLSMTPVSVPGVILGWGVLAIFAPR